MKQNYSDLLIHKNTPPPVPYTEDDVKEVFWFGEDFDKYLPRKGFITDFILSTRGIETPTKFSLWSSIFILSSALYRDAWIDWKPIGNIYPNFFIIVVAPPRICPKSTAAMFGLPLLEYLPSYYPEHELKIMKDITIIKSKATSEALMDALKIMKKEIEIEDKIYDVTTESKASVVISELATFLGKEKYNAGLISQLTDLYDCREHDQQRTIGRGLINLRNIYLSIFGATTPDGLIDSIPSAAMGDGFLSRLIIVNESIARRVYPFPRVVEGAPDRTELTRRLAWIAREAQGAYVFSPTAIKRYREWYYAFRDELQQEANSRRLALMQRFDIHVVKLSLIIRAQRYERGNTIEVEDFEDALRIMEATLETSHHVLMDVGVDFYTKSYNYIIKTIKSKKRKTITRRALLTACSPKGINADLVGKILNQLVEEGKIAIRSRGEDKSYPSRDGHEQYIYRGH